MPSDPRSESSPDQNGPSPGPWVRLVVTLLAPVSMVLLTRFGPRVVDTSAFPDAAKWSEATGVFALGIMPFVSASYLVELIAALVPRWAPLRHGGPAGRAKLARATRITALVLCVSQAFGIASLLAAISSEGALAPVSRPVIVLTLTAGAFLLYFLAQIAGAWGLAGGIGLLLAASPILGEGVSRLLGPDRGLSGASPPQELGGLALLSAAAVAVTWYTLRPRVAAPPPEDGERSYRAPPKGEELLPLEIPGPAGGLAPILVATSLLALPASLVRLGLPLESLVAALQGDAVSRVAALVLVALLSIGFAWAFNRPARIAALREDGRPFADLEAEARAQLVPAIARTTFFSLAIFGLGVAATTLKIHGFPGPALALATALVLDVAAELRARRAAPDLVPVWPEQRPYALAAARGALRAAGIPVHARDERLRRMFQFFGPYVPIELMVRREHAERAGEILAAVLGPKTGGEPAPAAEATAARPAGAQARLRPAARGEVRLPAALSLAVAALIVGSCWVSRPPARPRAHASARALEVFVIDDESDPLADAKEPLPAGASIQLENAPLGPGRVEPRRYVRVVAAQGESLEQARARLAAWAAQVALPSGDRIALARLSEYDETKQSAEPIGWRTYLLKGPAEVDGSHVVDAEAFPDAAPDRPGGAHVAIDFDAEGAARFAALTRANLKRRMAIAVEGIVETAPVIYGEIPGGHVQITMGGGDPEQQLGEAKQLARKLRGE